MRGARPGGKKKTKEKKKKKNKEAKVLRKEHAGRQQERTIPARKSTGRRPEKGREKEGKGKRDLTDGAGGLVYG